MVIGVFVGQETALALGSESLLVEPYISAPVHLLFGPLFALTLIALMNDKQSLF